MNQSLSFAVHRLIHFPPGNTSGTLILDTISKNIGESLQASDLQTFADVLFLNYCNSYMKGLNISLKPIFIKYKKFI